MEFPVSIQKVLERAIRELDPDKIVLFGSRSRGDAHARSDFDFAFFGVRDQRAWLEFSNDVTYEPPTLYPLDVMQFERLTPEFQASVIGTGKVVYSRV